MRKQVEAWQRSELTDVTAKVVTYEAFMEGKLEAPKHLARAVHDLYFEPRYEEFRSRNRLESFECVHFRIQGTGTDSPVQGDSQAGRIPGGPVLPVVVDWGAVSADRPFPTGNSNWLYEEPDAGEFRPHWLREEPASAPF